MFFLISWLQSPSIVILDPKKIKSVSASTFPPKGSKQDRKELDVAYGVNKLMAGPLIRESPCSWSAFGLGEDD